jgi:uncharacterized membrane protein
MKKLKQLILGFALILGVGMLFAPAPAFAQSAIDDACANDPNSTLCANRTQEIGPVITTVINVLLFIVGIISVIMIIVGGIMYSTSAGDAGAVTKAKNTIMFAVVGLIVAFLAFAIVNWVIDQFI